MPKILVHLATGFEEMEALVPVDVWRRAGFEVETVSINDNKTVVGAHDIPVVADKLFNEVDYSSADMIFLPGGMPGSTHLDAHVGLRQKLIQFNNEEKKISAICAAPLVLGHNGLLKNKNATCFPGFENELAGANYTGTAVEVDDNIITGKGAGVAMQFALEIVKQFLSEAEAIDLANNLSSI